MNIEIFTAIMAGVIFLAALRMLFSGKIEAAAEEVGSFRRIVGGGAIALVIGCTDGLLGSGGGVFIVPLLIFVLKVFTKIAAATSIFIVVFSSFSGFVTHLSLARANWHFILVAALFSFGGGQVGSWIMAERVKGSTIRRLFGVVLLLFGSSCHSGYGLERSCCRFPLSNESGPFEDPCVRGRTAGLELRPWRRARSKNYQCHGSLY